MSIQFDGVGPIAPLLPASPVDRATEAAAPAGEAAAPAKPQPKPKQLPPDEATESRISQGIGHLQDMAELAFDEPVEGPGVATLELALQALGPAPGQGSAPGKPLPPASSDPAVKPAGRPNPPADSSVRPATTSTGNSEVDQRYAVLAKEWASDPEKLGLLSALMDQIANPTEFVVQGADNTCVAATLQLTMASRDPVGYFEAAASLIAGEAASYNNQSLVVSPENQAFAKTLGSPGDQLLCMFQSALMDLGNGSDAYIAAKDASVTPSGEKYQGLQDAGTLVVAMGGTPFDPMLIADAREGVASQLPPAGKLGYFTVIENQGQRHLISLTPEAVDALAWVHGQLGAGGPNAGQHIDLSNISVSAAIDALGMGPVRGLGLMDLLWKGLASGDLSGNIGGGKPLAAKKWP